MARPLPEAAPEDADDASGEPDAGREELTPSAPPK